MLALHGLAWKRLGAYLKESQLLGSIQNTLYWDQNTSMPCAGASWRAEQLSLLAKQIHERQSSDQLQDLLNAAKAEFEQLLALEELQPKTIIEKKRNIQLLEQDIKRQKSLDTGLVVSLAKSKSKGYELWQKARSENDFQIFAPALKELISLRHEEVRQLCEPRTAWETLAQPFEPDLTISRLNNLFDPLRKALPQLLDQSRSIKNNPTLSWELDPLSQGVLANQLFEDWSIDRSKTCLSQSPHPFSITLGPCDFRLTNRVVDGQPLSCFLATAHELGHSLYEQGLPCESHQWFAWPVGQATSMAVHESQSLFWENRVARSRAFSKRFWPIFVKAGAPFSSSFDLWRAMNRFKPCLNRVEADELTYGLHILIRTDLEIALIEGGLPVDDLPAEWNSRYKSLLGIQPNNDREGCLQDVHWSEGQFGYFPSYLLGHLISAQLSESMSNHLQEDGFDADDPIESCINKRQESLLLSWLRKEVHPIGRNMNSDELVETVTGSSLSSESFLKYLDRKLKIAFKGF